MGPDGNPHDSLGVLLGRGRVARRVRVVAADVPAGLAIVRLVPGPVGRVVTPPANRTALAGAAVAVVGIPAGISLPEHNAWHRSVPPVSAVPATIRSAVASRLTLDLYGAERGEASVVFDRSGRLLGLLAPSAGGGSRDVPVIPASRLAALLSRITGPTP